MEPVLDRLGFWRSSGGTAASAEAAQVAVWSLMACSEVCDRFRADDERSASGMVMAVSTEHCDEGASTESDQVRDQTEDEGDDASSLEAIDEGWRGTLCRLRRLETEVGES